MPDKPCEDCGGTVFHHPDCARRDVVAVRVEAEQGLREIVARQTDGSACEELTGFTPEGLVLHDKLEKARRYAAGVEAANRANVVEIGALRAELKAAKRLRADDLALLAHVHALLARALGVGIEVAPETCAQRLIDDRDALRELVKGAAAVYQKVEHERNALLEAGKVLAEAYRQDRRGMRPLAQNSDRMVRALYEFINVLRPLLPEG